MLVVTQTLACLMSSTTSEMQMSCLRLWRMPAMWVTHPLNVQIETVCWNLKVFYEKCPHWHWQWSRARNAGASLASVVAHMLCKVMWWRNSSSPQTLVSAILKVITRIFTRVLLAASWAFSACYIWCKNFAEMYMAGKRFITEEASKLHLMLIENLVIKCIMCRLLTAPLFLQFASWQAHCYKCVCSVSQVSEVPGLDFDIDIPSWNTVDTGSTCTGTATYADICVNMAVTFQHEKWKPELNECVVYLFNISMM